MGGPGSSCWNDYNCYDFLKQDMIPVYDDTEYSFDLDTDITGTGVAIGYLGTGYLVLTLTICYYLIDFEPRANPFGRLHSKENEKDKSGAPIIWWRPNPIDTLLLESVRKVGKAILALLPGSSRYGWHFRSLNRAFTKSIMTLCDIQIVTGFALLGSGYVSLRCGLLSSYWTIICYLAWFSSVTHLSGLTVIRNHFVKDHYQVIARPILMLILFIMLLVALAPTALFDLAPGPAPVICFFDRKLFDNVSTGPTQGWSIPLKELGIWAEFQTVILSEVLLVIGLLSRCFKLLQPLSGFVNKRLRHPLSAFVRRRLQALSRKIDTKRNQGNFLHLVLRVPFWFGLVMFLTIRILVDLWTSMLTELYWLVVIIIWGTVRLFATRYDLMESMNQASKTDNPWNFGQILPIMLLAGPAFSILAFFGVEIKRQRSVSRRTSWPQQTRLWAPETIQSPENQLGSGHTKVAPIRRLIPYDSEYSLDLPSVHIRIRKGRDWVNRDYYSDASWIGVCILPLPLCIGIFTFIFFWTLFEPYIRVGIALQVLGVWIDNIGLLYYFVIGLPLALATDVALGLALDNLFFHNPPKTLWLKKAAFLVIACLPYLFLCLALIIFQWQPGELLPSLVIPKPTIP